jgi:hypothetical protein
MKIVSIHQPNYIPWLGYFYKIDQSDVFVFLDDVQFSNQGMHNFHYIKMAQGPFRLKIPVAQKMGDLISQVRTKDELDWKSAHVKTIEHTYKKAHFFEEVYSDFSSVVLKSYSDLASMNQAIIEMISSKFGFTTEFVTSSHLNISTFREEKVLDICAALDASVYYSGTGAKIYQDEKSFTNRNIELRYSQFTPFEYPQFYEGFQSNITVLDYLMHCGYDWNRVLENQK